jgi:hypothetical protein
MSWVQAFPSFSIKTQCRFRLSVIAHWFCCLEPPKKHFIEGWEQLGLLPQLLAGREPVGPRGKVENKVLSKTIKYHKGSWGRPRTSCCSHN